MTIALDREARIGGLSLRLPALASLRLHQSWAAPQPASSTHGTEMWLADLDTPVRLSRWAQGFRSYDLGAFDAVGLAARKREILDAAGLDGGRVLMLAHPSDEVDTPRIHWVLDDEGQVVAHAVEIIQGGRRAGLFVAGCGSAHVTGSLEIDGLSVAAEGQLRVHLDDGGVRVGLQLTTSLGVPLVTISMTGTLASGSSRALIHSAQRTLTPQRVLAA